MNKPKISVIMSVYNGMPYLKESTQSILQQSFVDFEFIIVDDKSTDKSNTYLTSLKDSRVKIITNKKNLGLAASLNKAMKLAKGTFIARMDADDISANNRLEEQYKFLTKHKDISICGSWAELIDGNGKILNLVKKPLNDKEIKKMNKWVTGIIHPTWFLKKEVYEELKGYDEDLDMVEDFDFLLRAKKYKMANISKRLLKWRSIQSRRSKVTINKMYKKTLKVRWKYFAKGEFGVKYSPLILRSIISTYLFPASFKIYLNKKSGQL